MVQCATVSILPVSESGLANRMAWRRCPVRAVSAGLVLLWYVKNSVTSNFYLAPLVIRMGENGIGGNPTPGTTIENRATKHEGTEMHRVVAKHYLMQERYV